VVSVGAWACPALVSTRKIGVVIWMTRAGQARAPTHPENWYGDINDEGGASPRPYTPGKLVW